MNFLGCWPKYLSTSSFHSPAKNYAFLRVLIKLAISMLSDGAVEKAGP